jgi:amidase
MTRTVKDAALMLDVLVGFDIADPYTATAAIAGPPLGGSYASDLDATLLKGARLGVLRSQGFGDDSDPECAPVNTVINSALETFRKAGTTLIDVTIPDLAEQIRFTAVHLCRSRSDIDAFLATKPHLATSCADILASKRYHPTLDLLKGIMAGPTSPADDPTYIHRVDAISAFQRQIIGIIASNKLDALVYPDVQIPAATHADALSGRWATHGFPTNTLIASQARLPAISIPAGFTAEGLPVGLELVALPYQEQKLLQLAFGVEGLVKGRKAPVL